MPLSIHPLAELPGMIAPPMRLCAMDIGTKTIGIALSTPDWSMVTPLGTVRRINWAEDLRALDKILKGFAIGALIVGLPYQRETTGEIYEGPQAQSIRQTTINLINAGPKWMKADGIVCFWDEALSTAAASEILFSHHTIKSAKQSGALDAMAAVVILERAFKFLNENMNIEE